MKGGPLEAAGPRGAAGGSGGGSAFQYTFPGRPGEPFLAYWGGALSPRLPVAGLKNKPI